MDVDDSTPQPNTDRPAICGRRAHDNHDANLRWPSQSGPRSHPRRRGDEGVSATLLHEPTYADVGHRRSLCIRPASSTMSFNFSLRSFDRMTGRWSLIRRWTVLWRHVLRSLLNPLMGSRNRKRVSAEHRSHQSHVIRRRVCCWTAEIGDPAPVHLRPDVTRARHGPLDAESDAATTSATGSEDACLGVHTTHTTRKKRQSQ